MMMSRAFVSSTLVSVGLSLAFALAVGTVTANRTFDARAAMSCFAIAGKIACIEVGSLPVAPVAPPVMGPIGPNIDGENEDIVIRDDGGRHVATG
jgi:hypothetical protein